MKTFTDYCRQRDLQEGLADELGRAVGFFGSKIGLSGLSQGMGSFFGYLQDKFSSWFSRKKADTSVAPALRNVELRYNAGDDAARFQETLAKLDKVLPKLPRFDQIEKLKRSAAFMDYIRHFPHLNNVAKLEEIVELTNLAIHHAQQMGFTASLPNLGILNAELNERLHRMTRPKLDKPQPRQTRYVGPSDDKDLNIRAKATYVMQAIRGGETDADIIQGLGGFGLSPSAAKGLLTSIRRAPRDYI